MAYTVFPNSIGKFAGPYLSNPFLLSKPQPSFAVNFDDDGSGIANLVVFRGAATPTFTRATTATTVLSTGLIGSVASGSPRSYYDPTSLTYLGYLAEGARTNLVTYSIDFDGHWTTGSTTVSATNITSPDGTNNASRVTGFAGGFESIHFTTGVDPASSTYTGSIWLKGSGTIHIAISNLIDDEKNVSVTLTSSWVRYTTAGYTFNSTSGNLDIRVRSDAGDTATSCDMYGGQVEAGAFESSYIPTLAGSTVTRNADVLTYPTSPWLNAAAGTINAQVSPIAVSVGITQIFMEIGDGTGNERYFTSIPASGTSTRFQVVDGGVNQAVQDVAAGLSSGVSFKIAAAYAAADFIQATDSTLSVGSASGTLPTVTTLYVGIGDGGTGSNFFGPIRRLAYYNTRLANGVLQNLTT